LQKNYPNPAGAPNNNNANNNGTSGSNLPMIENSLKYFIQAQTEQNKILIKIRENHDTLIGKLSNQAVSLK
jgi:hypothetical protein